jgi:hypothetical protein
MQINQGNPFDEYGVLYEILKYIPPIYAMVCKRWKQVYYESRFMIRYLTKYRSYINRLENNNDDDVLLATTNYGFAKPIARNIYINLCYGHIEMYKQHKEVADQEIIKSSITETSDLEYSHNIYVFRCLIKHGYIDEVINIANKAPRYSELICKYIIKVDMLADLKVKYSELSLDCIIYIFKYDAVKSLQTLIDHKNSQMYAYAKYFNATKILQYYQDNCVATQQLTYIRPTSMFTFKFELAYLEGTISFDRYLDYYLDNAEYANNGIVYLNKVYYKHELYINLFSLAVQNYDNPGWEVLVEILRYDNIDKFEPIIEKICNSISDKVSVCRLLIKRKYLTLAYLVEHKYGLDSITMDYIRSTIDMSIVCKL